MPSDAGLLHLKDIGHLDVLGLKSPNISDAGLKTLARGRSLRLVLVGGDHVTNDGVSQLQRAMPGCEIKKLRDP